MSAGQANGPEATANGRSVRCSKTGPRMSKSKKSKSTPSAMTGRWQIPLFILGITIFAGGIGKAALDYRPSTFEEQLANVRVLRIRGQLPRASAYLMYLLNEKEHTPLQKSELHLELAQVIYLAEARMTVHDPRNVEAVILNLDEALRHGAEPKGQDWVAVADAYRWSGRFKPAVAAYLSALDLKAERPDRLHRNVVELKLAQDIGTQEDIAAHIDAILDDQGASPDNYLWAVERSVQDLLRRGDPASAMHVITVAKTRLCGTEYLPIVSFSEALALRHAGLREEAIELLTSLREEWGIRDELWARAGYLLGVMEKEDARPQSALGYFDDVLKSFETGAIHDQCLLGRAECLASLDRYEEGLQAFREVKSLVTRGESHPTIDAGSIRQGMTRTCDELTRRQLWSLSAAYLETAMQLVDPDDTTLRIWYLSRLATSLREMGERVQKQKGSANGEQSGRFKDYFVRAADVCFELSQLTFANDQTSAKWMEQAATDLGDAGETDRMIQTLKRVTEEYPLATGRADALHRLGAAYHAVGEYKKAKGYYRRVMEEYPRTPPALESTVPLADCLISLGGDDAIEGVRMLVDIVDDRGPDQLFSPKAVEYREALLLLAQYYSDADPSILPDHVESAIARLEAALSLYPDHPDVPRLRFMLAKNYRLSASRLREEAEKQSSHLARLSTMREADRRLEKAAEEYDRVIRLLASQDASSLSDVQLTYLRSGYLDRGDVLFDLQRYPEAIAAYSEAGWRYENTPTSLTAMLQVVNCHQRLGELQQARAALARLGWLIKKTPAGAFDPDQGMSSKDYWENLIARLERTAIN